MPAPIRVAQILGITSSLALSGSIFTYSYAGIPAVSQALAQENPMLACQQWNKMYTLGRAMSPPLAVISAGCFGWVWFHTNELAYAIAMGLVVSIIPWTLAVMKRTNDSIAAFTGGGEYVGGEAAVIKKLFDRWTTMNFIRALFPLAGGVLGLVTALP